MVNDLKVIIKDFINLPSKIQTDNSNLKQYLKDKNLMLEACQKEYQKIYFEHENFLKKYQQLEEQLKQQQEQQEQQQSIKNLPRRMKNKKPYFITDVKENENDYENDDYENDDDDYDHEDDEVEYIEVKKNE